MGRLYNDGNITMTTKSLALATSIILLTGFSGAAYAATATPAKNHRVAHVRASQRPVEVSSAYASTPATEDRGPHYHSGPKVND
jgi:hypothetical protein